MFLLCMWIWILYRMLSSLSWEAQPLAQLHGELHQCWCFLKGDGLRRLRDGPGRPRDNTRSWLVLLRGRAFSADCDKT